MADIPNPRSRSQILGSMITAFLSRTGVPNLAVGNPIRSILESAAQSDLRTSQDIFNLLNSMSLDLSSGIALDRIGFDEGVNRLAQTSSQGTLTISDTSFDKVESRIYQGAGSPIAGSSTIKVEDATDFGTAPFDVYIGRGTTNYEGPLTVSTAVDSGSYWTLTLSSPTTKFHQLGEKVTLAQGGDRTVAAGTLAKTSGGASGVPVNYRIVYAATIADGETEVTGVQATCQTPGQLGNAVANSIVGWQSEPFSGAAVTNPTPFINGRDTENDDDYRERIRDVRQSRSRGTALAIKTAVTGIVALDENKSITSSSLIVREGEPATLYIDDGTGYEEQDTGVSYETLIESAIGGEQYFQLANGRPVAKAYLETSLSAPFELSDDARLAFEVGGERTEHAFASADFDDITSASSYEIAESINANADLGWSARTTDNGTKLAVFAKVDTNEAIAHSAATAGTTEANDTLGFGSELSETIRLFKNDRLLSKDGQSASISSKAQSLWDSGAIVSGGDIGLSVDNIDLSGTTFVTISDTDFVDAGTAYTSVAATNSLASWAAVLNYKIPGITATVSGSTLVLTSNRGLSADAEISITGTGSMDTSMFGAVSDVGADSDYTLDRNLGQIKLNTALEAGDKVSASSSSTRSFLETPAISALTIAAEATSTAETGAELWFMVDGAAEVISTAIAAGSSCAVSLNASPAWGDRVRYTFAANTFGANTEETIAVDDWVIITDTALNIANRGAYRIARVDTSTSAWFEVEQPTAWANVETVNLTTGNIWLVRGDQTPQRVFVDDGANETAYSIAADINTYLVGATAEVYETDKIRVRTNSLGSGDIACIGANETAKQIGFEIATAVVSGSSSVGFAVANHLERGTPQFVVNSIATSVSSTSFTVTTLTDVDSHHIFMGLKPLVGLRLNYDGGTSMNTVIAGDTITQGGVTATAAGAGSGAVSGYIDITSPSGAFVDNVAFTVSGGGGENAVADGTQYPMDRSSNFHFDTKIADITGAGPYTVETRSAVLADWLPTDRFYSASPYAITGRDQLIAVLDEDEVSKRYAINMYRKAKPTSTTYSQSSDLEDSDNGGASLALAFGTDFDWKDFAVHMQARVKDDSEILWRYYRHGPEGNNVRIQYAYWDEPDQTAALAIDNSTYLNTAVKIKLPTGSLRSVPGIRNSSKIGIAIQSQTGDLFDYIYVLNLAVASATRVTKLNYDAQSAEFTLTETVTGGTTGATGTISADYDGGGATGTLTLTGVAAGPGGYFQDNEALTDGGGPPGAAVANGTLYGYTTLTLTLPGSVTNHGISVGQSFYLSGSGAFTSGIKIAAAVTANTISYVDSVSTPSGPTLSIGTVSRDTQGEVSASGVIVGDIFNVVTGTSIPAAFDLTVKTNAVNNDYFTAQYTAGPVSTTLAWYSVNDASLVQFYPISASNTTADIVADIGTDGVIVGTEITPGTVSYATYEAAPNGLGGTSPWYTLTDGINYVKSTNTPGSTAVDFTFTFKNDITAGLATNSDWINEDVRLVPITAQGISDFLNEAAVSGLFDVSEVDVANEGASVQIATDTLGSGGSVEIRGGGANYNIAAIDGGSTQSGSNSMYVSVANADADALMADSWVAVINEEVAPKSVIDASTNLTSITTGGVVTLNNGGTKAWTWATTNGDSSTGVYDGRAWQIEKHGDFVAIVYAYGGTAPNTSGIVEGDWVVIENGSLAPDPNTLNLGTFRVVRIDTASDTFWIENSDAVEEISGLKLSFIDYNSIMPGDTINIGTDFWGTGNQGVWTVDSLGADQWVFNLDVSETATEEVVAPGPAAIGSDYSLIQVWEGSPTKLIKYVSGISPNASNANLTDIKFSTDNGYANVGEVYGSFIRSLDKLFFQVDPATGASQFLTRGVDGYKQNTGLIAEANKVIYGDESNSTAYPGVAAAGAQINISGPLVRRIEVSLALRIRTGVSTTDIQNKVKSGVANVINQTGVGKSIPLSKIVAAAQAVNGVEAVTVLSPEYASGSDLIDIQPYEKPLVTDVDADINISFVGD